MPSLVFSLSSLLLLATHIKATSTQVRPQVRGTPRVIANVTDPSLTRDSCGSVKIGTRALWVCRDTTGYNAQAAHAQGPLVPNSASWTDFNTSGGPLIIDNAPKGAGSSGANPVLLMYGGSYNASNALPFYPLASDECPTRGICPNGSDRFAVWPNQPPMVALTEEKEVTAYTWISKNLITRNGSLDLVYPDQAHSLYRFVYAPPSIDQAATPDPQFVAEDFWKEGEWGYGASGTVVRNGVAYLYAQNDARSQMAVARVAVESVEDRSKYEFYVNGAWTAAMPSLTNQGAFIGQLGASRQGTFYYSDAFGCYVWIGEYPSVASTAGMIDFVISTAPEPEGPWITPYYIHSEPRGDGKIGAYSIQAHPELGGEEETDRSIYLTYTKQGSSLYVTPLIYMEFK